MLFVRSSAHAGFLYIAWFRSCQESGLKVEPFAHPWGVQCFLYVSLKFLGIDCLVFATVQREVNGACRVFGKVTQEFVVDNSIIILSVPCEPLIVPSISNQSNVLKVMKWARGVCQ